MGNRGTWAGSSVLLYCWHSVPVVQVRATSPSSSWGLCTCCSLRPQRLSSCRHPPRVPAQTPARPRPTRQTGPGPSVLHPLFCLCGISQNTHYWSRCLIPFSSEGGGRVCLVPTKPQHLGRNLEVPEGVRDSTVSHRNEPDHLPRGSGEREGPSSSGHRRVLVLGLRSAAGGGGGAFGRTPHQRGAARASARGHAASLFPLSRRHHQPLEKPR